MPNWCDTRMTVSGPADDLLAFALRACGTHPGRERDVATTIAEPRPCDPPSDPDATTALVADLLAARLAAVGHSLLMHHLVPEPAEHPADDPSGDLDAHAMPAWYRWRLANWGVKWDLSDVTLAAVTVDGDGAEVTWKFQTPWGPPLEFVDHVARRHPGLHFTLHTYELGNDCCETWEAHGDIMFCTPVDIDDPAAVEQFFKVWDADVSMAG